jgi:hypothetical protein
MKAQQLFKQDGTPIDAWYCADCGKIYADKRLADEICCKPNMCDECGTPLKTGRLRCDPCQLAYWFNKAEKVTEYDDVMYDPRDDRFFLEMDEITDWFEGNGFAMPEWVFTCKEVYMRRVDANDVIEMAVADLHDEAADDIDGKDELNAALSAFYEANKNIKSYYPNYKLIYVLSKEE